MSEVCGRPGFLHLESSRVCLRLIHTDYTKHYIAGHWKTGPKGLPAWGATPHPSHTHWRKMGGAGSPAPPPPGPDAYELLKTPHRLVRSQYCGIVWVKEEGSWRDLDICASPKVGGQKPPSAPPAWKVGGGRAPPCPRPPLFLRLCLKVFVIQAQELGRS